MSIIREVSRCYIPDFRTAIMNIFLDSQLWLWTNIIIYPHAYLPHSSLPSPSGVQLWLLTSNYLPYPHSMFVNGNPHYKYAFNSQACEQLNAWLKGFSLSSIEWPVIIQMVLACHVVHTHTELFRSRRTKRKWRKMWMKKMKRALRLMRMTCNHVLLSDVDLWMWKDSERHKIYIYLQDIGL